MIEDDLAAVALRYMGESGQRPSIVVIGAMDGVSFDDYAAYIREYRWTGLFVEPNPTQFRRLQRYYAQLGYGAQNKYENSAIADHDGTVKLMIIDQDAIDEARVHPCFGGMSAIYPPRNGLASAGDAATVAQFGRLIDVNCLTLAALFARHDITAIDVLSIDAEGWDYDILRQLDFSRYRPRLIRCEVASLAAGQRDAVQELLTGHGYFLHHRGANVDAVPQEFRTELESFRHRSRVPLADAVTLVTAVFAPPTETRAPDTLAPDVERLLSVDWPLVVFAAPAVVKTIREFRRHAPTFIIARADADLERFAFRHQVLTYRLQSLAAGEDPASARATFRQDVVGLSRQFFLNDASIQNPFGTPYFLWIEPAVAEEGTCDQLFTAAGQRHVAAQLADDRMHFLASPVAGVAGACFGGSRSAVNAVNGVFYTALGDRLDRGPVTGIEKVLTGIARTNPELCSVHVGEGDAPLRDLFGAYGTVRAP